MARRPKGSYFRNTPDWFFNRAASVGANNPGQVGLFSVTDLFNDATDGSLLYVYEVYLQNSGAFSCRIQQVQGNCGGVTGPGYPVNFAIGSLPGSLFIGQLASIARPNTDPYISSVNTPAIDFIKPPGPVAIVPPGYSLRVANNQPQFGFIVWFYYVVMSDSGG